MVGNPLPLISGLPPSTFRYGTIILVEFEPHSVWYEMSLTLAARALAAGVRTDYHTFRHVPEDVVDGLTRQGIDVSRAQREARFRLIDSYSPQTGLATPAHHWPYEFASQSLRIVDWKQGSSAVLDDLAERRLVHIDEDDSVLVEYNREGDVIDFFQTRAFEAARKRDFLFVHAFMKGIHSRAFYRKFESLADVILDFQTREAEGHLENVLRVRSIRGVAADTRWRLLALTPHGEVRVLGPARSRATPHGAPAAPTGKPRAEVRLGGKPFRNRKAGLVFESLVAAFLEDSRHGRIAEQDAGWRSLVQVARDTCLAPSSLYPRHGAVNPIMGELASRGLVETRVIPGARGRGGITLRVRVAYDQPSVQARVHREGRRPQR